MFCLGEYQYESKEELKRKLRGFLASAPEGCIKHPIAIAKLDCLLQLHPRAEEKVGVGVKEYWIERNHQGSGRGFKLVRTDGSEERFSYKSCIDGQIVTNHLRALEALRFSVRQQRNEFRNSISLPTRCSISDRIISNRAELHIDHKVPFWKVVSQFCRENEIDLNSLSTVGSGEELKLTDDIVQLKFQEFHQTNAKLQATHKEVNLQMGGKFDEA
jgi:hypothetical protein